MEEGREMGFRIGKPAEESLLAINSSGSRSPPRTALICDTYRLWFYRV